MKVFYTSIFTKSHFPRNTSNNPEIARLVKLLSLSFSKNVDFLYSSKKVHGLSFNTVSIPYNNLQSLRKNIHVRPVTSGLSRQAPYDGWQQLALKNKADL